MTNSWPTPVHIKPCPTTVFKDLIWIFATTTKIYSWGSFTQIFIPKFSTNIYTLLFVTTGWLQHQLYKFYPLQCYSFLGLIHSAGKLLHTPWQISTSMTIVQLFRWTNTLHGFWYVDQTAHLHNIRFIPHHRFCLPRMAHLEESPTHRALTCNQMGSSV